MLDIDRKKNEVIAQHLLHWHWIAQGFCYHTPDGPQFEWQLPDFVNDRSLDTLIAEKLYRQGLVSSFLQALAEIQGHAETFPPSQSTGGQPIFSFRLDPFLLAWSTPEQRIEAILKVFNVTL